MLKILQRRMGCTTPTCTTMYTPQQYQQRKLRVGENEAIHRSIGNNALDKHLHKSLYIPVYPVYKWQRGAVVVVLNTHISVV